MFDYLKDIRMWCMCLVVALGLAVTDWAWSFEWAEVDEAVAKVSKNIKPIEFTVYDIDFKYSLYKLGFATDVADDVRFHGSVQVDDNFDYEVKGLITITF